MSRESDRAPLGVGFGEGLVGSRMERVEGGENYVCGGTQRRELSGQ